MVAVGIQWAKLRWVMCLHYNLALLMVLYRAPEDRMRFQVEESWAQSSIGSIIGSPDLSRDKAVDGDGSAGRAFPPCTVIELTNIVQRWNPMIFDGQLRSEMGSK